MEIGELEHRPPRQWNPGELDGTPRLPPQLEGWRPDEIDGTQVRSVK